jgi:hypothetical protein
LVFSIPVVLDNTDVFGCLDILWFLFDYHRLLQHKSDIGFLSALGLDLPGFVTIIAFYSISRVLVFVRFRIGPSWFCDHHRLLQHKSDIGFLSALGLDLPGFVTIIAFYSIGRILVFCLL